MGVLRRGLVTIRNFVHFQKLGIVLCLFLLLVVSILDGLSIASVLPLLTIIVYGDKDFTGHDRISQIIMSFFSYFHLPFTMTGSVVIILILFFGKAGMRLFTRWQVVRLQDRYEDFLLKNIAEVTMSTRMHFSNSISQGAYINMIGEQVTQTGALFFALADIIVGVLAVCLYALFLTVISFPLAVCTIFGGITLFLPLQAIVNRAYHYGKAYLDDHQKVLGYLLEIKQGIKLIKSLGDTRSMIMERLCELRSALSASRVKVRFFGNSLIMWAEPLGILMILVLTMLGHELFGITSAKLLLFLFITIRLIPIANQVFSRYGEFLIFLPAMERVQQYLVSAKEHREKSEGVSVPKRIGHITFDSVSFSYVHELVLQDISFTIQENRLVFLLGPSGAGKSTIIDLLMGFYKPSKGAIFIDGMPLTSIDINEWRKEIAYIPQSSFLFSDTILRNICLRVGYEDIVLAGQAASLVHASDFIVKRGGGYAAMLTDGGSNFSGGQRQRLALARALTPTPRLLIVDEPTNALDSESTQKILTVIRSLHEKMTVLFVTHDRSLLQPDDVVILIEGNKKVEKHL